MLENAEVHQTDPTTMSEEKMNSLMEKMRAIRLTQSARKKLKVQKRSKKKSEGAMDIEPQPKKISDFGKDAGQPNG